MTVALAWRVPFPAGFLHQERFGHTQDLLTEFYQPPGAFGHVQDLKMQRLQRRLSGFSFSLQE